MMADHPLVLFDGVCGLCNRAVDFVIARDTAGQFHFSPLQSPAGQAALQRAGLATDYADSIVLIEGDRVSVRSNAALRIARRLGWPWRILFVFIAVPSPLRDAVYNFIARRRYKWFGKTTCRLPSPAERGRFVTELDPTMPA